jgi:hypothetical protein
MTSEPVMKTISRDLGRCRIDERHDNLRFGWREPCEYKDRDSQVSQLNYDVRKPSFFKMYCKVASE